MVNIEVIQKTYLLHWLVWNNDYAQLNEELSKNLHDIEKCDNRGRTPLLLAVTLGHLESTMVLLDYDANVNTENVQGWSVVQEAVGTGNPELLKMVLARRDHQRYCSRVAAIPELLHKLKQAPDFYVEMKWEFTSWVPLATRMCPSDTCKVYKQGSNVRIDKTLLGFNHTNWQRGDRSYIFKGETDGATMVEIDHDTKKVYVEHKQFIDNDQIQLMEPSDDVIFTRLTNPIVNTYIDTDKISFERSKTGIWGWRSDKSEFVNGHECKVFGASNVELITKTRMEHLTDSDKVRVRAPKTPLHSFLGFAEQQPEVGGAVAAAAASEEYLNANNPSNITPEEYFDPSVDLQGRDIGRPKEISKKVQKFKATLWLCGDYPLSLQEQIMPIVDLMAISSSHFAKLKDFIQMQLPAGFPVKIEIPLFHILNAKITFGNIFGLDQDVPNVTHFEDMGKTVCLVDDVCFEAPSGYTKLSSSDIRTQLSFDEEDDSLQLAIQQSLIETGNDRDEIDIWGALNIQKPSRPPTPNSSAEEERQLQRAIQVSLAWYRERSGGCIEGESEKVSHSEDQSQDDLELAIKLSEQQHIEDEQRRLLEEEIYHQAVEFLLTEK